MAGYSFRKDAANKESGYGAKGNYVEAKPVTKNNGCKSGKDKNSNTWINGWNVSKDRGMVKVNIHPYKNTKVVQSSSDNKGGSKTHVTMMANIHYLNSGITDNYPVIYCLTTGTVLLKKHGWLLNTIKGNMTRYTGPKK